MCKIQVTENRLSRHPRADPTEGTSSRSQKEGTGVSNFSPLSEISSTLHALDKTHLPSTYFVFFVIRFDTFMAAVVVHRFIYIYYAGKSIFAKKRKKIHAFVVTVNEQLVSLTKQAFTREQGGEERKMKERLIGDPINPINVKVFFR